MFAEMFLTICSQGNIFQFNLLVQQLIKKVHLTCLLGPTYMFNWSLRETQSKFLWLRNITFAWHGAYPVVIIIRFNLIELQVTLCCFLIFARIHLLQEVEASERSCRPRLEDEKKYCQSMPVKVHLKFEFQVHKTQYK